MSAEQTLDIADVLAEHEYMLQNSRGSICRCGFVPVVDADSLNTQQDYHRAHVAAALAPVLAASVREAEQRAWDDGMRRGQLHWSTNYGINGRVADNPYRADRITEPVSHEAATSGEEASKA